MSKWTDGDIVFLRENYTSLGLPKCAMTLRRSEASVRGKASRLGVSTSNNWSEADVEFLRTVYVAAGSTGAVKLDDVSSALGRNKANICRKARSLGLTNNERDKVDERKDPRKFKGNREALITALSESRKKWHQNNGHPRGMKGKRHTPEAREMMSVNSKKYWEGLSEEEKSSHYDKVARTRAKNNSGPPKSSRGTWKAGWREFGGKRNYYRSRWEANYGRYLEFLKVNGQIEEWAHEPETFWFEKIRRGVRSYKPDFRVWENDGTSKLHEVKGWMDARSKTCLKRMAKYHPEQEIVLIDGPVYRSIRLKVMHLCDGWEDSKRDTHA